MRCQKAHGLLVTSGMNRSIRTYGFAMSFLWLFSSVACTHSAMRGTVVMTAGPDRVHVCLGANEVKVGDTVVGYRDVCGDKGTQPVRCTRKVVAHGVVVEVLDDHYSVVRTTDGDFEEHDVVEKAP